MTLMFLLLSSASNELNSPNPNKRNCYNNNTYELNNDLYEIPLGGDNFMIAETQSPKKPRTFMIIA